MKIQPKPHQVRAIKDILEGDNGLLFNNRAQYISACGTGKTLVSIWANVLYLGKTKEADSALNSTVSVFMYPSLALIAQSHNSFSELLGNGFKPLIVCSEQKIGQQTADVDDMLDSDFNYPTCTDSSVVAKYLSEQNIRSKTIMVTYHSAAIVAEALKGLGITADITIYDEAHKTAQGTDGMMSFSLSDDNFPSKKRLFMTATPRHSSLETEEMEFTMDNEKMYGKVAHELSMRKAISLGLITDYQIIGGLSEENIDPTNQEEVLMANIQAFVKAIKTESSSKVMLFSDSISTSKTIVRHINEQYGDYIEAMHIDGSMPHAEREAAMSFLSLKSHKVRVLSNSKLLSEGVDVSSVDMVGFLNATKSETDIIQRVGRVQRLDAENPNKIGKVFVPIIVNQEGAIVSGEEHLLATILALKENDEQLKTTLSSKTWSSGDAIPGVKLTNRDIKNKSNITSVFAHLYRNIQSVALGGFLEAQWHKKYQAVAEFVSKHKRLPFEKAKYPEERKLGIWCFGQRNNNNNGKLSDERRIMLEKIPDFFKTLDDIWMETYHTVVEFLEFNKKLPSITSRDQKERKLGIWIHRQKTIDKKESMPEDRKKLLNTIPHFFETNETKWNNTLQEYLKFVSAKKRSPNKRSLDADEKRLGAWVSQQKELMRRGELDRERENLLKDMPFFTKTIDDRWHEDYSRTKDFIEVNKKLPNKRSLDADEKRLGIWIIQQKQAYEKNILREDRMALLEKIPNFFKSYDDIWDEKYQSTSEFVDKNKRLPSQKSKDLDEKSLGGWCSKQRQNNINGKLDDKRREMLESIPGFFKTNNDIWDERYRLVAQFVHENGKLPSQKSKDLDEKGLGAWCSNQRLKNNNGKLDNDHREMLEEIPGFFRKIEQGKSLYATIEQQEDDVKNLKIKR